MYQTMRKTTQNDQIETNGMVCRIEFLHADAQTSKEVI